MDERTNQMNDQSLSDNPTNDKPLVSSDAPIAGAKVEGDESVEELRSGIEQTRASLSETIDAIQDKLDPQKLKQQATDAVREATLGRAQEIGHTVSQHAQEAATRAQEIAHDVTQQAREKWDEVAVPALEKLAQRAGVGSESDSKIEMEAEVPFIALPGSPATSTALAVRHEEKDAKAPILKPIEDQVVVIMGASSGIGRETALQFARRGARVVVAARGEDGLRSLVKDIEEVGGEAFYVVADVADFAQVDHVASEAVRRFGRIDTWVHASAVSLYATFEQTTPQEFKRLIEVNLVGQAYGAMAALPHLRREGRGALIHISSVEGKRAFPLQSAYSASKHGIIGFLDALRMELKRDGVPISVTNVMPAGINTPFFNKARTKMGVKPMPAPPIYQPSVVAEAILHAAEHPTRDIFAGGAGKMLWLTQRLSPALLDAILTKTGFEGQQTKEPKSQDAPDNLDAPIAGYDKIGGDFGEKARSKSASNWLETHPQARRALKSAALGTFALWFFKRR